MILILGGSGQVGTALRRLEPSLVPVGRDRVDLASANVEDMGAIFDEFQPEAVINCAAYTAVDRAEDEEELATRVNGEAVGILARVCSERGVQLVTYSTDYVFDGTGDHPYAEDDLTAPINAYGRSKLIGETSAMDALMIRTSWVISGTHPNFVATMLRLAGAGRSLRVVDDQRGRPTVADDLATATLEAMRSGVKGILHIANEGETTWYELARAAVDLAGMPADLISPCPASEYPTPAPRPAYSVLSTEHATSLGLTPLPHWRQSLPGVVAELSG